MGLWGLLFEVVKAVVPHTAPHVARAVVNAAKERREARTLPGTQPSNESLAGAISYLEQRLSAAEERAAAAEQRLSLAEARMADKWASARKWGIALLAWNAVVTAGLIYLALVMARR